MKTRFFLALTGAACAVVNIAQACSCAPPPPPKQALEKSAAVFVGRVASVKSAGKFSNQFQFSVSKQWKGIEGKTASIVSATDSAACGINFDTDRDYLVYAFKSEGDDQLKTNLCTRTKRVSDAADDLAELGDPVPGVGPTATAPTDVLTAPATGVTQLNAATITQSARPLTLLLEALRAKSADSQFRVNWKFNWHLDTFPPTIRSGTATALYNRQNSTLTLYSKYSDAVGNYVKHVRYDGVTEEKLRQLADTNSGAMENFAYFDKLPQVGADATDLGSSTHKRRVFNLK